MKTINNYITGQVLKARYNFEQIDGWKGKVVITFTKGKKYEVISHTNDSFTVIDDEEDDHTFSHKFVEHLFDIEI